MKTSALRSLGGSCAMKIGVLLLLLMAMIEDMVAHEIAFREPGEDGQLLVFPSQLTRENPDLPDPDGKDLHIDFIGPVLNVYATLVVRLTHSSLFRLSRMWRNAAVFAASAGGECGIFLSQKGEGTGSLTLFYEGTSDSIRRQFEEYVVSYVKRRAEAQSVRFKRSLVCPDPSCRTPIPDKAVAKRLENGLTSIVCSACEKRIPLSQTEPRAGSEPTAAVAQIDLDADTVRDLEVSLLSASGEMLTKRFRKWAGASRATLALVFTDIVGSTRLGEELGDEEMFRLRAVHFTSARKHIRGFTGYEIKTIGDAFMVAFRTATEALNFCMALQKEPGDERLSVRAGIHVGPVRIDEDDAFGRMVNFAARVVGAIKGAEIWMSDRAYSDIIAERAAGHRHLVWNKQGGLALKGFDGRHTLWRLGR
jgi:class 3 adenylate cyclase